MRNYLSVALAGIIVLMSFQVQASTGDSLIGHGIQQPFNWQQEWGGINFNGSPDPGIDSSNLQPKADIKRVVSQDGTQTSDLSGITTFKVDLNGDGILDSITDGTGYFQKYQLANPPLPICVPGDGCYISIYLFDQNTSLKSGGSSTTKYNTHTVYSERILGWKVITSAEFETWATGKHYQLFNANPVLVTLRNNNICYEDEIAENNNQCVKYLQFVGDPSTGSFMDLYNYQDSEMQPQYDTRFTYTTFDRDTAVLARGMVINGGFGQVLKSGGTIDLQIANMTYYHPDGQADAPAFHEYHIANKSDQSLFVPTNTDKEFSGFLNAATSGNLSGVSICKPPLKFTEWCGDQQCPAVRTTATTIAAQRFCISGTSDYRPCSECMDAAAAVNGVGWPSDWQQCCHKTQECAPNACIAESDDSTRREYNGTPQTLAGCEAQADAYFAKDPTANKDWSLYGSDPNNYWTQTYLFWGQGLFNRDWCVSHYPAFCQDGHVCVAADSMITLSDGTSQRIDAVKAGDTVLGFATPKGKLKPFKVMTVATTPNQDLLKINGTLSITPNHRMIVAGGKEVQASQLKVGDVLLAGDRSKITIKTIETLPAQDTVYNLILDKPAIGFVANGLRVTDYKH